MSKFISNPGGRFPLFTHQKAELGRFQLSSSPTVVQSLPVIRNWVIRDLKASRSWSQTQRRLNSLQLFNNPPLHFGFPFGPAAHPIMTPQEIQEIGEVVMYYLTLFLIWYLIVFIVWACTKFIPMLARPNSPARTTTLDTRYTGEENSVEPVHACKCPCHLCKCSCHELGHPQDPCQSKS